ncbi:hypothetical protein D9613_007171 [Agrocybe pediades]|uniref:Uncharacterized protein n=1 Tax=Agrocybe pediades TaxID=84607 RepID=A0A8H4QHM5_9AGAR|nr:hypothetical protein D9613_007171 [Agrocybe pediades]
MPPTLPLELCQQILEELSLLASCKRQTEHDREEYRRALRECILVSRAFRHSVLKHIYEHIDISNVDVSIGAISDYILKLRELFEPPPNSQLNGIGRYVKNLTIFLNDPPPRWVKETTPETLSTIDDVTRDENFVEVLRHLRGEDYGITSCTISLWSGPIQIPLPGLFPWTNLSLDFRNAFYDLVHSPTLTSLDIRNIFLLPTRFLEGTHLTYLRSQNSPELPYHIVYLVENAIQQEDVVYPELETLVTDNTYPSQFLPGLVRNLKEYVTVVNEEAPFSIQVARTTKTIEIAANSLKRVHINHYGNMPLYSFDLSDLPHLTSFSHHHTRDSAYEFEDGDIARLYQLLDTKAPLQSLMSLGILVNYREFLVSNTFLTPFGELESSWKMIADLLSSSKKFPALVQLAVTILVNVEVESYYDFDLDLFQWECRDRLEQCFAQLPSRIAFRLKVNAHLSLL